MLRCYNWLSLFLFPAFCTYCKDLIRARKALCPTCMQMIKSLASTKISITEKYQIPIYTVGAYQEPLKQLVLAKLYGDKLACYYMAQLMYEQIAMLQVDYLVPIPLHWTRYAKRGYNQSEEIAHYLSRKMGVPMLKVLKRTKQTPFQSCFDKVGRQKNMQDAFQLVMPEHKRKEFSYKRLVLIDDVMTTGATLHAAGRALLALKPLGLSAVVLARTH